MSRVEAILAWLNVYSKLNGLPQLDALEDVWREHLGSLGFLCHAHECHKKTFFSPHEAFKDAQFVLTDLQDVKESSQKILHYQSVNFGDAASGSFLEIYKVVLLMLTEVLIYFRKCSDHIADTYYKALQDDGLEGVFAEMMGQVISPDASSWWDSDEVLESLTISQPMSSLKVQSSSTPNLTPRKSLCRPSIHRLSTARKPSFQHGSPLKELFESPRLAELSHNKEVVKLKNRIEELLDEVASKDDQIRDLKERHLDAVNEFKTLKQILNESQHNAALSDESYTSLDARFQKMKQQYNDAASRVDSSKQHALLLEKQFAEMESRCEVYHQQMLQSKEQENRLKGQMRDADERIAFLERIEDTLESNKIVHNSEMARIEEELSFARTLLDSERRKFKDDTEKQVIYYEALITDIQNKFASSEKLWNEEQEKLETELIQQRSMLLTEQQRSDDNLRSVRNNYEQEVYALRSQLKQTSLDASTERQRHLTEIHSLNEKHLYDSNYGRKEHEDVISSCRKQHDAEIASLSANLEIKDKIIEQQKEEIERYKLDGKNAQEKIIKSQEGVSFACKREIDLRNEWQLDRSSWQEERLSLQTQLAELDRHWRSEYSNHLKIREDENCRRTTTEKCADLRATGGSEQNLDETLICSESEEPTQMGQRSVDVPKPESFFISFDEDDYDIIVPDRSYSPSDTEATILESRIKDTRKAIKFDATFYGNEDDEINDAGGSGFKSTILSEIGSQRAENVPLTEPLWQKTSRDRVEVFKKRNEKVHPAMRSSYVTELGDYISPSANEDRLKGFKKTFKDMLGKHRK